MPAVSERLIADDRIAAVTLTGSNRAGEAVGAAAGSRVKKAVLELGGSDAFVVLADADVAKAAATAVQARFNNAGQSCVCAKRFIVEASVADEFIERFVDGRRAPGRRRSARDDDRPSARWLVTTCATASHARSTTRSRPGAAADRRWPLPGAGSTSSRPCCRRDPGCRPSTRRRSGPVGAVAVADDEETRSGSPTPPSSGLGSASGPLDRARCCASLAGSPPGPRSSTRWSRRTRGCRSVAPSAAATDASCPPSGSASS